MAGMNSLTGRALSGVEHLRQSIIDILTTPIGSRAMRRGYGSDLPYLIDAPVNSATLINIYSATAVALDKWEPRFKLSKVQSTGVSDSGETSLTLEGEYLPNGNPIVLDGVVI